MARILFSLAFVLLRLVSAAEYEWAGIFETPGDVYTWTAQKAVDGDYADPAMKLAVFAAETCDHEGLHSLESSGNQAMSSWSCTDVSSGGTIVPVASSCYKLIFNPDAWQTLYTIDAAGVDCIAFFAEHVPTEFELTDHYLKDNIGTDIEPIAELPEVDEEIEVPWGGAIVSTLLVNIVTLVGVIMLISPVGRMAEKYGAAFTAIVSGFAAGALLSCAFFLLLFEATHLVAEGWDQEVDVLWRWGTMILMGFILPPVLDNILGLDFGLDQILGRNAAEASSAPQGDAAQAEEGQEGQVAQELKEAPCKRTRQRLIGGVLLGDFFHNLCDGFFMGAAFKGCGVDFGWKVAIGTILHEFPQELADFIALTGPDARLHPVVALALNFASGLSVLLGAIIILATDVAQADIGLLLCFGGGVYLHLGATDLMPKIYAKGLTKVHRLLAFLAFAFGTVLIGLILIGHEHCAPGGHAHGH